MENNLYCSMIHGGLMLNLKTKRPTARHCCIGSHEIFDINIHENFWENKNFIPLRNLNNSKEWSSGCSNCEQLEKSNIQSFRQGMNSGLGITERTDLTGPARIDILFDISCNLACRTCGPSSSTFWQKHLKENNLWTSPITTTRKKDDVITALSNLDLSNLKQVVFCGGETLLGREYWSVAEWLVDNVPNAKKQLTICFQTNGTQPITNKDYDIISRANLVKLHVSIDGIKERFEYIRWPASWNQIVENLQQIKETCPSNVMFVIEETVSIFNLYYTNELETWINDNFSTNREGDIISHSRHLANGIFSLDQCSREYVDFIQKTRYKNLISKTWVENADAIKLMIHDIKQFDSIRKESFEITFPEIFEMYRRFW